MNDESPFAIDAACEALYNVRDRHADALDVMTAWKRYADEARNQLEGWSEQAFGESADERIDIFPARGASNTPAVMFIHGGYWQGGDKRDVSFVAPLLNRAGIAVAINNYALAPGATLDAMVAQTRVALHWLCRHAARFGIDPKRIHVMGHSAGGHLATMMLTSHSEENDAPAPVQSAIALSGLFDLTPLVHTSINRALALNAASAARLSPVRLDRRCHAPVYTLVGEGETAGFFEQQARLATHWRNVHPLAPVAGKHHYTILDVFREPANRWLDEIVGIVNGNVER